MNEWMNEQVNYVKGKSEKPDCESKVGHRDGADRQVGRRSRPFIGPEESGDRSGEFG